MVLKKMLQDRRSATWELLSSSDESIISKSQSNFNVLVVELSTSYNSFFGSLLEQPQEQVFYKYI